MRVAGQGIHYEEFNESPVRFSADCAAAIGGGRGKLEMLKEKAERSAEFHGHALGPWNPNLILPSRTRAVEPSIFIYCGEWVEVDTYPLPDGLNIGGTAVAVERNKQSGKVLERNRDDL